MMKPGETVKIGDLELFRVKLGDGFVLSNGYDSVSICKEEVDSLIVALSPNGPTGNMDAECERTPA